MQCSESPLYPHSSRPQSLPPFMASTWVVLNIFDQPHKGTWTSFCSLVISCFAFPCSQMIAASAAQNLSVGSFCQVWVFLFGFYFPISQFENDLPTSRSLECMPASHVSPSLQLPLNISKSTWKNAPLCTNVASVFYAMVQHLKQEAQFLKLCLFLWKARVIEKVEERHRGKDLYLLVYSPNNCNGCRWVSPKSGARSFFQASYVVSGTQQCESFSTPFPDYFQGAELGVEQPELESVIYVELSRVLLSWSLLSWSLNILTIE